MPQIKSANRGYHNDSNLYTTQENRKKYLSAARLKPDQYIDNTYNDKIDSYNDKMRNPAFKNGSSGIGGVM